MTHSRIGKDPVRDFVGPELAPACFTIACPSRDQRAVLFRQMLATLEDTTLGGRRYLMEKVLVMFRREVLNPEARFSLQQRVLVTQLLKELEHEAKRVSPGVVAFQCGGQLLVDLFALT